MKHKILSIMLAGMLAFSQFTVVSAKTTTSSSSRSISKSSGSYSGSSSSKSSAGSSSSTSGSYSGSSSSKSSAGSSSKSSGSYSGSSSSKSSAGSSSKSSGSYSGSSASRGWSSSSASSSGASSGSTGFSSKTATQKNAYMSEQYKAQTSGSNYSTYKENLNSDQKKTYDESFNKSYTSGSRMNFEDAMNSRSQRINDFSFRPIFVGYNPFYFSGPLTYGMAFAGPWDLWFLMRASDLFWYHHWNDISPYRNYFQESQFQDMENRVKALEQKYNGVRDPNYLEPGVDPDLQFSSDYTAKNIDKVYATGKYSSSWGDSAETVVSVIIAAVIMIVIIRRLSRSGNGTDKNRGSGRGRGGSAGGRRNDGSIY